MSTATAPTNPTAPTAATGATTVAGAEDPAAARAGRGGPHPPAGRLPGARPGTAPVGPAGRRPGARPPRGRGADDLATLARAVALLWIEVECGRRPLKAVAHLFDRRCYERLRRGRVRPAPPGRLLRVRVDAPRPGAAEVVAVVQRGRRTGAVAFQLRRRADGWCVEAAARPEDAVGVR